LGYTNVRVYSEGITGWIKAGLTVDKDESLARPNIPPLTSSELLAKRDNAYLLDTRLEELYKKGHITGSRNIPYTQFSRRFREIPMDRTIVIIDMLGNPEYVPLGWFLKNNGYSDVSILKGGMTNWQKEGLPVEKNQ